MCAIVFTASMAMRLPMRSRALVIFRPGAATRAAFGALGR